MKKIIYLFCLLFVSAKGQQNLSSNKEYFDELEPGYSTITYSGNSDMPDAASWLMMSYLNLYETTKDKAYLVKFMNSCINAILQRRDIAGGNFGSFSPKPPMWTQTTDAGGEKPYYNTLLLLPMSKFIYLVRSDDSLLASFIPDKIVHVLKLNSLFSSYPFFTYNDFSNWLGERVEETMWYLNAHYWDDDYGHLQGADGGPIGALNFQSLFAAVYLYKYKINHTFGYWAMSAAYLHDKIDKIHDLYLGQHVLCNHCPSPRSCHAEDVFLQQTNNSFNWYHLGWRELCDSDGDNPGDFMKEDLAHGGMDLIFPMADWNTGAEFFTTTEFHNWAHETFTKNIYYNEYKFYNNVWGSDVDIDGSQSTHDCSGNLVHGYDALNFYWGEILTWMPLCAFDNTGNSVYDALILHAYKLKNNTFTSYTEYPCKHAHDLSGETSYLGLSEVVKAQWQRECVDLTLGNRDLIYDQNFFAPGSLYIKPSDTTVTIRAFAEPNNDTIGKPDYFFANKFVIEDTVKSEMVASTGIHFYPGFHGKEGCYLHAYINPDTCSGTTNPFHMPTFEQTSSTVKNPASLTPDTKPAVSLTAVPGGDQLIYLNSPNTGDRNQQLLITDLSGRVIANYSCLPSTFTTSGLSSGLYLFIYSTVNGKATQKVMIY